MKKSALKDSTSVSVIVEQLRKKSQPLVRQVEALPIKTKDDYNKAAKLISQLKEFSKEAERQEKTFTDPAKQIIKNAQEFFRPFRNSIAELEVSTKHKMLEFTNRQEKKLEELHQNFGKNGGTKKLSTLVRKENELMDTSSENASVRKVWTLTIVDETKIPREFLVPDETLIRSAFREGKKVNGCVWKQENQIAI